MMLAAAHATSTGSPSWYAIVGALGAAIIVSIANQLIARRQRTSDGERFDRQLQHDREMRREEMRAADDRLRRQLDQDREQRELQHIRSVLGPIVTTVVNGESPVLAAASEIKRINKMAPDRSAT